MNNLLIIYNLVSMGMFVIIWFIQLTHYPMFENIDEKCFSEAMEFHQRTISYIVMPLMLVELGLTVFFVLEGRFLGFPLAAIVSLIWLSTFFIQVPLHNKLLKKKDSTKIRLLVKSNWIRTILWSIKLILILIFLK